MQLFDPPSFQKTGLNPVGQSMWVPATHIHGGLVLHPDACDAHVWPSVESIEIAVTKITKNATIIFILYVNSNV